ncbi:MAG TPA: hypothetical protein VLC54_13520 [Anaeromyxobacter sp.]|nr:hypothetical protein [Anaeromyxobacter sp.]
MGRRALFVMLLAAAAGCMPYHRARPGAETWRQGVTTVGVLPAIRILEIAPGNVEEEHEEWTELGAKNVVAALTDGLKARGLRPKVMSWKADDELDDVRLLYAEVAEAIWLYAYPPYAFPHKTERFEYAVGPIGRILDRAGADVLLVAAGQDRVGSDGRKLSMLAGMRAMALLTLGLVDREGNVVWFDVWGGAGIDLREDADVRASVEKLLSELPGVAK